MKWVGVELRGVSSLPLKGLRILSNFVNNRESSENHCETIRKYRVFTLASPMTNQEDDSTSNDPLSRLNAAQVGARPVGRATQKVYDARVMCDEEGLASILLDDKLYTLRITKTRKLILTK